MPVLTCSSFTRWSRRPDSSGLGLYVHHAPDEVRARTKDEGVSGNERIYHTHTHAHGVGTVLEWDQPRFAKSIPVAPGISSGYLPKTEGDTKAFGGAWVVAHRGYTLLGIPSLCPWSFVCL
jgi:hypothetical protein